MYWPTCTTELLPKSSKTQVFLKNLLKSYKTQEISKNNKEYKIFAVINNNNAILITSKCQNRQTSSSQQQQPQATLT